MKTKLTITIGVLICFAAHVQAFDGNRKGFILGGGLGIGYTVFDIHLGNTAKNDAAIDFVSGYAWDEQNMIALWHGGAGKEGFSGPVYTRYFSSAPGRAYYLSLGAGLRYSHSLREPSFLDFGPHWPDIGPGLLIGGGYEFVPHYQIHMGISYGKIAHAGRDYHIWQIKTMFMALAF